MENHQNQLTKTTLYLFDWITNHDQNQFLILLIVVETKLFTQDLKT